MNYRHDAKKPHVLFVAPSAYTLGGVQTWLDYIVPGLDQSNFNSSIALTCGAHHDANEYLRVHPFTHKHFIKNKTGTIQGRVDALEDLIKRVQPDVLIVVNIADVYQAVSKLRRQSNTNVRVVTSLHGIHPALIEDINQHYKLIDAVISTNRLTQQLVTQKTRLEPSRSLYAPYGVAKLDPIKRDDNDQLNVAYVGRFEEDQKRISDLLNIFDTLLNASQTINILIAGDGDQSTEFSEWLQPLEQHRNIHYMGVLDSDQLREKVYQKADLLLLTSQWETGPIVAWEAMSHGVVLISSKYIGHLEEGSLTHEKNCLLFEIGDVNQAAAAIQHASDKAVRDRLRNEAFELIDTKYSINQSINTWSKCITQVLEKEPKPHTKSPQSVLDRGILSSLLGQQTAERVRSMLRINFSHSNAGSEWPHSYNNVPSASSDLLDYIKQ